MEPSIPHILIAEREFLIALDAEYLIKSALECRITLLRPEQLEIVRSDAAGALPVNVSERVFLGESVRYLMRTDKGYVFTVQNSNLKRDIAVGDRVGLTWQPEDVWVLPA